MNADDVKEHIRVLEKQYDALTASVERLRNLPVPAPASVDAIREIGHLEAERKMVRDAIENRRTELSLMKP